MRQFVLLLHSLSDTRHWDLMLDFGEVLATWQILDDPTSMGLVGGGPGLAARRLADHRREYLEYEGPVSGDRGSVSRIDRGEWFLLVRQEQLWTVRLAGEVLHGTYLLSTTSPQTGDWVFQCLGR